MLFFAFIVNFFFFASLQRRARHCNVNTLISLGFQPCREADAQYSNRYPTLQAQQ